MFIMFIYAHFHDDHNPSVCVYRKNFLFESCELYFKYFDFIKNYFGLKSDKETKAKMRELQSKKISIKYPLKIRFLMKWQKLEEKRSVYIIEVFLFKIEKIIIIIYYAVFCGVFLFSFG